MLRGTLILGVADFSKKALLALTVLLCARLLPHKVFGDYLFLLSFYQVFSVLGGSGIPNTLIRDVSQKGWIGVRPYLVTVLARIVYVAPVGILMYAAVKLVGYSATYLSFVAAMTLLMTLRGATENGIAIFQARGNQVACAQISIVQSAIALAGTLLVCLTSKTLAGLIWVLVLAAGVSSVLAVCLIASQTMRQAPNSELRVSDVLRTSGWLNGGSFLASAYNRMDVLLLRRISTADAVATYSAPYRLLDMTQIIPSSLMGVLLPRLCRQERESADDFRVCIRYLILCALLLVVSVTMLAPLFTKVVLGKGYEGSIFCLQILVLAVIPMFWNFALNSQLIAIGYDRGIVLAAALALAFNLSANLLLIPRFGYIACASMTCLTEIVLLGTNLLLLIRRRVTTGPDFGWRIILSVGGTAGFWCSWVLAESRTVALVFLTTTFFVLPLSRKDAAIRRVLAKAYTSGVATSLWGR